MSTHKHPEVIPKEGEHQPKHNMQEQGSERRIHEHELESPEPSSVQTRQIEVVGAAVGGLAIPQNLPARDDEGKEMKNGEKQQLGEDQPQEPYQKEEPFEGAGRRAAARFGVDERG